MSSRVETAPAPLARALPGSVREEILRLADFEPALLQAPERLLERRWTCPAVKSFADSILARLNGSQGFDVVRCDRLPQPHRRLAYAMLGLSLGEPILRYGLLYAVADRGQSHLESRIPVSMTRASTGMHTDSSARDCVPGLVGLYCERASLEGGTSRIADAEAACAWLGEHEPEVIGILERPYLRDVVTPGLDRGPDALLRNRFPVVARTQRGFLVRYMRFWIEKGHERAGIPLSEEATMAFDRLDAVLARPEFSTAFRLEAGDALFLDNCRRLHGRDAYAAVPEGGRLLWRMWLDETSEDVGALAT